MEIARRVLARAREGIPFDRMAVLLRSPEEYRANLEEAFGAPVFRLYFARGARRPDPAGRAFFALLRCAAEGLSARRFAEYLSLGQVPDAAPGRAAGRRSRGDQWVEPESEAVTEDDGRRTRTPGQPTKRRRKRGGSAGPRGPAAGAREAGNSYSSRPP